MAKKWYDGYVIGKMTGIYNPWSVTNYLDEKKLNAYWGNTSSVSLISGLIWNGGDKVQKKMESLLKGECISVSIDEEIVNYEVFEVFQKLVRGWFSRGKTAYNCFVQSLLAEDSEKMPLSWSLKW